jgi:hypothetical protein
MEPFHSSGTEPFHFIPRRFKIEHTLTEYLVKEVGKDSIETIMIWRTLAISHLILRTDQPA